MRAISQILRDRIANMLQVADEAPSMRVEVKNRYYGDNKDLMRDRDIPDEQEWYQLSNMVLSIEVSESTEQFASSFTVTFANDEGILAPDNYTGKWPNHIRFRGHHVVTYAGQLRSNNEVRIFLGYGDRQMPFIHGFVSDTRVSAESKTVTITCMTSYKHLIHQTIRQGGLQAPDGNLYNVLRFFFEKAGVTLRGERAYVPGAPDEEWIIKGAKGVRGQTYDEVIRELIDTTYHYIKPNFDGTCTLVQISEQNKDDVPVKTFDEYVNLTSLEYTATEQDVYCAVAIKSGNSIGSFYNNYLYKEVLLGRWKEEHIEVPWADTHLKRRQVAIAHHTANVHKHLTNNVGIVGDPSLELWDTVAVREQSTSQQSIYHIKGIQSIISHDGFVQVLDISENGKWEPEQPADAPGLNVPVEGIRIKLWDYQVEDGDMVNVYVNGRIVAHRYVLRNVATPIDITLKPGRNQIVIEAVRTPEGNLTGKTQILDRNNNILYDVDTAPGIVFPRVNVNSEGYYTKRPSVTWTINWT